MASIPLAGRVGARAMTLFMALWLSPGLTCQLVRIAEFPVTVVGNRPLIDAQINGQVVRMLVDSGSDATMLSRPAAQQLGLKLHSVSGLKFYGVGGSDSASSALVREFTLGKYTVNDLRLIVTGWRSLSDDDNVVGVIGEDFLSHFDVEFDFPHDTIRLFQSKDCADKPLAYWNKPYSLLPIVSNGTGSQFAAHVMLNGQKVLAILDSGASISMVTPAAAKKAGVTPQTADIRGAGAVRGLGAKAVDAYTAVFDTLTVGDETIQNAKLTVADMFRMNREAELGTRIGTAVMSSPGMLLGADFLRSHRVYVAREQEKIYFSYEGGPVFQLPWESELPSSGEPATPAEDLPAKDPPAADPDSTPKP